MTIQELIQEISCEYNWTQADIKRSIKASDLKPTTKAEIIACMIYYSGSRLRQLNRELSHQKRSNSQRLNLINELINQLNELQKIYAQELVPTLRETIAEQATYIESLLRKISND